MIKCGCVYLLLLWSICLKAQNLVPNPGFELYSTCPLSFSQLDLASPWSSPSAHGGTPDFIHGCATKASLVQVPINMFGYQQAHGGQGYAGLWMFLETYEYREYLLVPLLDTLQKGAWYEVSFYSSLADSSKYGIAGTGVYFSAGLPLGNSNFKTLTYPAQLYSPYKHIDTASWHEETFLYPASGGERWMLIGHFNSDLQADTVTVRKNYVGNSGGAYLYIDDISVKKLCPRILNADTSICRGDSLLLLASSADIQGWMDMNNPGVLLSTDSFIMVKPTQNTRYVLLNDCQADTVQLNLRPLPVFTLGHDTLLYPGQEFSLWPQPTGFASYLWQDGSEDSSFQVMQEGLYWLRVFDGFCFAYDSLLVQVALMECKVPNVFSPNQDGINDWFAPECKPASPYRLCVYNRWGEVLFECDGCSRGWDGQYQGQLVAEGTYFWILYYKLQQDGYRQKEHGTISLIS